jgi:hypothetical protein
MPSALTQGEPPIAGLTLCFQKFISRNAARKGEKPTDLTLHHSAQKRKYLHNIFTIKTIGKGLRLRAQDYRHPGCSSRS